MHLELVGHVASLNMGMQGNDKAVAGNGFYPRPRRVGHPCDSSSSRGRKLPTPPRPPCSEASKRAEPPQSAPKETMEVTWSPPLSWEDQVWEEEDEQERHSSIGGHSQPCQSSPCLDSCNASDISMADESLQQHDSNVVVEEEESMDMDEPSSIAAPAPLLGKTFPAGIEAEAEEDHRSHTSDESTDQNPPHDLDIDEDELLGPPADISVPGGHSDDSIGSCGSPR